jgi:hypothetical protein
MALNNLIAQVPMGTLSGPGVVVTTATGTTLLEKVVGNIIGILTILGVIYFIFQIIFAGYAFMSAQGDPKSMESARKRLTDGILGLTIIIVAVGLGSLLATLMGITNILDINAMFSAMGL